MHQSHRTRLCATAVLAITLGLGTTAAHSQDSNACPVDGCVVTITSVALADGEVAVTFDSNFLPDISDNHFHVWWGDLFSPEQVSGNAEPVHGVTQGDWHPTDAYPDYVTTGAMTVGARNDSKTMCVTAADKNHDVLDPAVFNCVSVESLF